MPSVKTIKNTAGKILNAELFSHISAMMLIAVCVMSLLTTGEILTTLWGDLFGYTAYALASFFLYAFTAAMIIPLIYGYAVFETNCVKNKKADFTDMFCAFSELSMYVRSFKVFYALLWRFAIVFAIPAELIRKFISYTNGNNYSKVIISGYDFGYTAIAVLIIASVIIALVIYSKFFLSLYITVVRPEKSVSECFYSARIYRKNCSASQFSLAISFIPLMILGILSMGIAFIYVIPLMLTSFFVFAHKRYENTELNEAVTNMIFN